MNYLIDTNLIVLCSRDRHLARKINKVYPIFNSKSNTTISSVTLGELDALTKKFGYGIKRQQNIESLIKNIIVINIITQKIIERYGDIDAFSQGKLKKKPLGMSARNMGKNDIWIAATASVYDLTLVTIDKDFQHLDSVFLDVIYVDLEKFK